ncbi:type II secretion system F family protein [Protaetiibacter sp. SSC-01]|uniref:type II secretion system F family protein n=1 Tax=Protaetiibacter sp. SSC-01 TaxID=2759943 RepID=UPI001656DFCB|nr:type II secretion system F family protein [Protaetiibacter sp. SSC-01]QNO37766.1 type II secretion system F family protein [Protaetiibacter sp. SSC-01]
MAAGAAVASPTRNWTYQGRDGAGKRVKGKLEAPTESAAVDRMRAMGLSPIKVSEIQAGTGLNREIEIGGSNVGLKDLAVLSRQAATMVSAGLSLLKTLNILAEQTENKKLKSTLATVSRDVEVGWSFSDALGKHPRVFPPLMVNMVRAGETGGFLDGALNTIAVNYEKEAKLREQIKSAMTYPVMVFIMSIVAVIVMLLFIVPIFKDMFAGFGAELPLPTMMLVWLSQAMVYVVPVGIVGGIAFAVWWGANKHTEKVRKFVDPLKLKIPVFGSLIGKIAITRFCRNLADMVKAGVPILQALNIVGEASGNWVIEQASLEIANSVRIGKSISGPLAEQKVFPPMAAQMIAVGEDAGALDTMLSKVADFYDDEVKATTEGLTSIIEPLLIAFLGIVVGGMVIALYMPIFSMINVVGGA